MSKKELITTLSLYTDNYWVLLGFVTFLAFIISIIFEKYIYKFIYRLLKKTPGKINVLERIWIACKRPVSLLIILCFLYFALLIYPFSIENFKKLKLFFETNLILIFVYGINRFFGTFKDKKLNEELDSVSLNKELNSNYYAHYFIRIIQLLVILLGLYFILNLWGKDVSSLITALGFISVAIAFSLRDTFSNIFSGIVIVLEKTFKIGDYVENEKVQGTIQDIGFRSTKIKTIDKEELIVPNSQLINLPLNNKTLKEMRKLEMYLILSYQENNNDFESKIIEHFNKDKEDEKTFAKCQKLFLYENKMVYKFFEFTPLNGDELVEWKQDYLSNMVQYCLKEGYNITYIGFEKVDVEVLLKK